MLVAYRCDSLTIKQLNELVGHENTSIGPFKQRAMFALLRAKDMNKAKEYTGNIKTIRLVEYIGATEDDIRALEFTAMIQDQTFNVLDMITDENAVLFTEAYKEAYKQDVDVLLHDLREEMHQAIADEDSCFTFTANHPGGSVSISANSLRRSELLERIARINDRVRDKLVDIIKVK